MPQASPNQGQKRIECVRIVLVLLTVVERYFFPSGRTESQENKYPRECSLDIPGTSKIQHKKRVTQPGESIEAEFAAVSSVSKLIVWFRFNIMRALY